MYDSCPGLRSYTTDSEISLREPQDSSRPMKCLSWMPPRSALPHGQSNKAEDSTGKKATGWREFLQCNASMGADRNQFGFGWNPTNHGGFQ